jgi:hypothetical protein
LFFGGVGVAASKPHVVSFGKWTTVKWMVGEEERTALGMKVRTLLVDGQSKEFTTGAPQTCRPHFVVRVFRLNDSLCRTAPERWRWERGGWLLDASLARCSKGSAAGLRSAFNSAVAWFRDYAYWRLR